MSVLSYLEARSQQAVLSALENQSINTSISTLADRLGYHFGSTLSGKFRFGSSTRGTILPRSMDESSDIDYMIVFAEGGYQPQTYLDRLRRFVEKYYSTSSIYQSSPTIVLELGHIKFDLVPALTDWAGYNIPNSIGFWQNTNPNDFNSSLEACNISNSYQIKPAIRLFKYWNARVGYVYDSFDAEKWIVGRYYWNCSNLKQYIFDIFGALDVYSLTEQWRRDRVARAKAIVDQTRLLEAQGLSALAEAEIKKLIPAV